MEGGLSYAVVDKAKRLKNDPNESVQLCQGHLKATSHDYDVLEGPEVDKCDSDNHIYDVIAQNDSSFMKCDGLHTCSEVTHSEGSRHLLNDRMSVTGIESQESCSAHFSGLNIDEPEVQSEALNKDNMSISDTYNHLIPKSKMAGIFGIKKLVALATQRCSKKIAFAVYFHLAIAALLCCILMFFFFNLAELKELKRTIDDLKTLKGDVEDYNLSNYTDYQFYVENYERLRKKMFDNLTQLQEQIYILENVQEKTMNRFVELQELFENISSLGQPSRPAASCAALLALSPMTPSGYYWVRTSSGSAVHVYCDMTLSCGNFTGGWTRVAELNVTHSTTQCPGDLRPQNRSNNIVTCGIETTRCPPTCSSTTFSTNEIIYSSVCGRITAYQFGHCGDCRSAHDSGDAYIDGVSLTYGSPRRHIWTFAASTEADSCCCSNSSCSKMTGFIGSDYFCDGVNTNLSYTTNSLWDGVECDHSNECCTFNNPPFFYKQLSQPTSADIEMRVCRVNGDDIGIAVVEIYVQ